MNRLPIFFWGKVKVGKRRGKRLGFPTANVALHKKIPEGIYISLIKIEKIFLPSLTFIGSAKTYNETLFQSETYIFDFDKSLYNKWLIITLLKKIRENKKFNSEKELIFAMEEDKAIAREYFKKHTIENIHKHDTL